MPRVSSWVDVRVASFNIHRESDDATADLDLVTASADVLVLQESADHEREIDKWLDRNRDWGQAVVGSSRPERQNRVLWRRSVAEFRWARLRPMAEATSGTPERHQIRVLLWIPLVGRYMLVSGDHVNSHIEKRSWWRLPRFRVSRRHIRRIGVGVARAARNRPNAVVLAALDCNINQRLDRGRVRHWPTAVMRRAGATSGYDRFGFDIRPTKGKRWIDVVFVVRRRFVRLVRHFTISGTVSDHNAYVLVIRIRRTRKVFERLAQG